MDWEDFKQNMRNQSESVTAQVRAAPCRHLRQPTAHPLDLSEIAGEVTRQAAPPQHFDLVRPRAPRDELVDPPVCVLRAGDLTRPQLHDRKALESIGMNARVLRSANDLERFVD